jgi:DNA polymerase-3 subunit epsilon
MKLDRPLCIVDLETTSADPRTARIVAIAAVRISPGTDRPATLSTLVNPGVPIPPEASAIHGITDRDVAGAPPFHRVASRIAGFIGEADLAGYNCRRFDIPVLLRHFAESRVPFPMDGRAVLDLYTLYLTLRPRTLASAVRDYLGREHTSAHDPLADAMACAELLPAMLDAHPELPRSVKDLEAMLHPGAVDLSGYLVRDASGEVVLNFGKYRGARLSDIARTDPSFLQWVLSRDFPEDTKAIVRLASGTGGGK